MGYSLSTVPSKVSVVIARRLNLPFLLFFPLWVAAVTLLLKGHRSGQPQSSFAIISFGLFIGLGAYVWFWNVGGKEKLEFTASTLTWKRTLLGISRNRIFRMNRIDNPYFENSRSRGKYRTPSGIGFSYEGKALRVGDHPA